MKKLISFLIAVLILISAITPILVSADTLDAKVGTKVTAYDSGKIENSKKDGDYYCYSNQNAMIYRSDGTTYEHTRNYWEPYEVFRVKNSAGDTRLAYCIQYGVVYDDGTNAYVGESLDDNSYWKRLPPEAQEGITYALIYGMTNGKSVPVDGCSWQEYYLATQLIIWEYQQQLRSTATSRHSNGYAPGYVYYNEIKDKPAEKAYDYILEHIASHETRPSFTTRLKSTAPVHALKYDRATGKYSVTLTDTNGITLPLKQLDNDDKISFTKSGSKYTFTADEKISKTTIKMAKSLYNTNDRQSLIFFNAGSDAQTVAVGADDPVQFYAAFEAEDNGDLELKKTVADATIPLEGWEFKITSTVDSTDTRTVTTDEDGELEVTDLIPGKYTVEEINLPEYMKPQKKTVTIVSGEKATVEFENAYILGDLKVKKSSEKDLMTSGVDFRVTGTADCGIEIDETITTDENGEAVLENIPIGTYTVTEIGNGEDGVPSWIVKPSDKEAEVTADGVTVTFKNNLKKGNLKVIKASEDNFIEGISFQVTGTADCGVEIDETITTDENGEAILEDIPIGTYTVTEIDVEDKYIVPDAQEVLINYEETSEITVENKLKRTKIIINKKDAHTEDKIPDASGTTFIILDENGELYKLSDGTSAFTTDADGVCEIKEALPYGKYQLIETKPPKGYELDATPVDFELTGEEGITVTKYNAPLLGNIKILKTSDDGIVEGFTFKVTGECVDGSTFENTYTTDKKGEIFIEDVIFGTFTVEEVKNEKTKGYVLPKPQTITFEEEGETIIFKMHNSKNPGTGLSNILIIFALIGLVVSGGYFAFTFYRKRKTAKH